MEGDLRTEQSELLTTVSHKQSVIDAQERRIKALNAANDRLISALAQLKDRYQVQNGLVASTAVPLSLAHHHRSSSSNDNG